MPERGFNTSFWSKPFIQNLPAQGKLLSAYLKTNVHCNQAGVYTITPSTIAFETGLPLAEIPSLLKSLEPEVVWYPEENIVWVKPFLEEQARSSKFIASALNIITHERLPEDVPEDFQEYNSRLLAKITADYPIGLTKRECVAIRDKFTCQYCQKFIKLPTDYEMDHVIPKTRGGKDNYLNLVTSCRACNQKKLDKIPNEVGLVTPHPRAFHAAQALFLLKNSPELKRGWLQLFPDRETVADSMLNNIEQHYSMLSQDIPSANANAGAGAGSKAEGVEVVKGKGELSSEEQVIIKRFGQLKGWQADEDDVHWLQGLRSEFPGFTLSELKACVDYYSGRAPPKHKGIWKNRFRNWMIKKQEFEMKGGKAGEQRPRQKRAKPITYIRGSEEEPGKD